jgi:hypothetical protein
VKARLIFEPSGNLKWMWQRMRLVTGSNSACSHMYVNPSNSVRFLRDVRGLGTAERVDEKEAVGIQSLRTREK